MYVLTPIVFRHWLYKNEEQLTTQITNPTLRTADLTGGIGNTTNDNTGSRSSPNMHVIRRVLSTLIVRPTSTTIDSRVYSSDEVLVDIWGSPLLSTQETMISPRPLGPTHILVIYSPDSHPIPSPRTTLILRTHKPIVKILEIPINDLLFVLNVPNLSPFPPLPRRLPDELPRVILPVPHLSTFHDLMIYIHTLNQAELFRRILPEWIRDLINLCGNLFRPDSSSSSTERAAG